MGNYSEQYKIKCLAVGASYYHIKGERLTVSPNYLRSKIGVFLEIGIKITQVISRKLDGSDENLKSMDRTINDISYDLISHEHYREAKELLDFAFLIIKNHPDAEILNMMIINRANAYKMLDKKSEAANILKSVDWSPFDAKYKVCVAAVFDDVDRVLEIMPQLKSREDFPPSSYRDWPVFIWIRTQELFLKKFQEIYEQPFTLTTNEAEEENEFPLDTHSDLDTIATPSVKH